MKITATFLDEITYDIPSQNWGYKQWDKDFAAMKSIGIDTVVQIRSGHNKFMTYPSTVMKKMENCFMPSVNLVEMFLELSQKYQMKFYFGNYCSHYFLQGKYQKDIDLNLAVMEEFYQHYGKHPAFGGWYLTQEISRLTPGIVDVLGSLGRFAKQLSGNLPVMISPFIDGVKNVSQFSGQLCKESGVGVEEHAKEWDYILASLQGAVDIFAFQDGACEIGELKDYMAANQEIARRYGMSCWTNCETFDRDMPIKFLPINWEKMLIKLKVAEELKLDKVITFEFSHFMSPNSCYLQARGLFERYCEYFNFR